MLDTKLGWWCPGLCSEPLWWWRPEDPVILTSACVRFLAYWAPQNPVSKQQQGKQEGLLPIRSWVWSQGATWWKEGENQLALWPPCLHPGMCTHSPPPNNNVIKKCFCDLEQLLSQFAVSSCLEWHKKLVIVWAFLSGHVFYVDSSVLPIVNEGRCFCSLPLPDKER